MVTGFDRSEESVTTQPVAHDPFRPWTSVPTPEADTDTDTDSPTTTPEPEPGDGLEDMLKPELIHLAEQRGLPTWGTKADLIERLRTNP